MSTTTVTAATALKNLSAMQALFSDPADALEESVVCAPCGHDDAYERFASDYLCEECLTLIGNVLATIQYGIDPNEDGTVSVVA